MSNDKITTFALDDLALELAARRGKGESPPKLTPDEMARAIGQLQVGFETTHRIMRVLIDCAADNNDDIRRLNEKVERYHAEFRAELAAVLKDYGPRLEEALAQQNALAEHVSDLTEP